MKPYLYQMHIIFKNGDHKKVTKMDSNQVVEVINNFMVASNIMENPVTHIQVDAMSAPVVPFDQKPKLELLQ